jgi:chromosome segregation ATPase
MLTGRFQAAADALQGNKFVMGATYDKAIEKGADRFNTVKNAVAQLMSIEQDRISTIKTQSSDVADLTRKMNGAKVAMQKRINALKAEGKSKEGMESDSEFIKHRAAYMDMKSTVAEKEARIDELEVDLEERRKQIATYKAELQQMQRQQASLREEKHEALADVAIANQAEAINSVLAGISADSTDKDLQAAREARKAAKAKAQITSELAGNDARLAENEYRDYALESEADNELDDLLDWGDNETSERQDVQIPD